MSNASRVEDEIKELKDLLISGGTGVNRKSEETGLVSCKAQNKRKG